MASNPAINHIMSDIPTLPEYCRMGPGDENMPDPIMLPIIKATVI